MIRILLAEDQAMLRGALAALLDLESDIEVLGACGDGESAWRELQRLQPDILVTDIEMPGLTGLELAQRIQRHGLPAQPRRVLRPAQGGQRVGAVDAGLREIGPVGQRLGEGRRGPLRFPALQPQAAKREGKLDLRGVERQRAGEGALRRHPLPRRAQGPRQIAEEIRVAGQQRHGTAQQRQRRPRAPALAFQHPQQMKRVGVARLAAQDAMIEGPGLVQPARLMVADRGGQGIP